MGAKKNPVFNNANVDGEGMTVELELPNGEATQLKIDFADIYDDGFESITLNFGDLSEHYREFVVGMLEIQCMDVMNGGVENSEVELNLIDNTNRTGYQETINKFFEGFDTMYQEYWKRRRNSEIIFDIKQHIFSSAWFQSLNTIEADKVILGDGKKHQIIKLHYLDNKFKYFDDTIVYALEDKINELLHSFRVINDLEEDLIDVEDLIDKAIKMKTENDYEKRNYYFDECLNNIPRNRPLEDTWE